MLAEGNLCREVMSVNSDPLHASGSAKNYELCDASGPKKEKKKKNPGLDRGLDQQI